MSIREEILSILIESIEKTREAENGSSQTDHQETSKENDEKAVKEAVEESNDSKDSSRESSTKSSSKESASSTGSTGSKTGNESSSKPHRGSEEWSKSSNAASDAEESSKKEDGEKASKESISPEKVSSSEEGILDSLKKANENLINDKIVSQVAAGLSERGVSSENIKELSNFLDLNKLKSDGTPDDEKISGLVELISASALRVPPKVSKPKRRTGKELGIGQYLKK